MRDRGSRREARGVCVGARWVSWGSLGTYWGSLGASRGSVGASWGSLGASWCSLGGPWSSIWASWGSLGTQKHYKHDVFFLALSEFQEKHKTKVKSEKATTYCFLCVFRLAIFTLRNSAEISTSRAGRCKTLKFVCFCSIYYIKGLNINKSNKEDILQLAGRSWRVWGRSCGVLGMSESSFETFSKQM